ncbi:hypothetical protein COOONC_11372, partial [Cooperia oncophora]
MFRYVVVGPTARTRCDDGESFTSYVPVPPISERTSTGEPIGARSAKRGGKPGSTTADDDRSTYDGGTLNGRTNNRGADDNRNDYYDCSSSAQQPDLSQPTLEWLTLRGGRLARGEVR